MVSRACQSEKCQKLTSPDKYSRSDRYYIIGIGIGIAP